MRLAYTAVTTLAALLSCSDSVPTAGDPKALLKHDVSLVAHATNGDDYGANAKRMLRDAHAHSEVMEAALTEERVPGIAGEAEGVVANVAHTIVSEANPIAERVEKVNTELNGGATHEKGWLAKLKKWWKNLVEWWKKHTGNLNNHVKKDSKVSPTAPQVKVEEISEKEAEATEKNGHKIATNAEPGRNVDGQGPPPREPEVESTLKNSLESHATPPKESETKPVGEGTGVVNIEKKSTTEDLHSVSESHPRVADNPLENVGGNAPVMAERKVHFQDPKDDKVMDTHTLLNEGKTFSHKRSEETL